MAPAVSRKRKRDEDIDEAIQQLDQRAAAQNALQVLQELIMEIFEAENDAQLDRIGKTATSHMVFINTSPDGDLTTLSSEYHVKLDTCLEKAISLGRFKEIPMDQVLRIQSSVKARYSHVTKQISRYRASGRKMNLQPGWRSSNLWRDPSALLGRRCGQ